MSETVMTPQVAPETAPKAPKEFSWHKVFQQIVAGPVLVSFFAVVVALVIGALLIAVTDEQVARAAGYFFSRPGDTFAAAFKAIGNAYGALFQGATYYPSARTIGGQLAFMETLTQATPLILAGLSVAVAFRAGLFNIGAQGQIILGAIFGGAVGFGTNLPPVIHLLLVIIAGALGGAIWGGIAGLLKARTGAHEVIVTIMLNYIAVSLLAYMLNNPFKAEGGVEPISEPMGPNAMFPALFGSEFRLNWSFVLAILAVIGTAWFLNRSTYGFELRAIGTNPHAARTAGMNVPLGFTLAMVIAGALAGVAGASQLAGTESRLTGGIAGSIGFDAITVALLGRSKPWGTFFAALLFGAFKAGGQTMEVQAGVSSDIVLVVQSLIVLFIAAPPLIRGLFGMNRAARKQARRLAVERADEAESQAATVAADSALATTEAAQAADTAAPAPDPHTNNRSGKEAGK
ncbi:ABC transporter permease [Haematomicrobium sanguinis]|uniref:ABC transporter permease n=1 Tax=Haematomicrobium sanguinis TaxID=479106 RepID=UPI0009496DF7|nr:ABC transporter permease [Haematomicrobium sanguinis]